MLRLHKINQILTDSQIFKSFLIVIKAITQIFFLRLYSDICHSSDICKNRAYFIDLLSLNSQSPITLEWLWEQLHRRFNSPERCHSQSDWIWIAIAVWLEQCSELSLLWWRLVTCRVFLNGTRHCWPFSPTAFSHFDLSDQDSWQTATSFSSLFPLYIMKR